jgi:hypothetical protein
MEGLLKMDPRDRLSAKDAIAHPFFDGVRNEEDEKMTFEIRSNQIALRR